MESVVPVEVIEKKILLVRGQKIMLDRDLPERYGVTTGEFKQGRKKKLDRFPQDFMFQLTQEENTSLRFQFGSLEKGRHSKYLPCAFTEQGVAMLSGVLRSPRAVIVNIKIMRAFGRLRQMLLSHEDRARKLAALEKKYDGQFRVVFEAIRQLMAPPARPRKKIGFLAREPRARYRKN